MMDRMGASSRLRRMYPVCSFTSSCRQDSIRLFSSSRRLSSLWYSDSVDLENISTYTYANILHRNIQPGMRIRIRSDPLIFGPPDPDPDPDPTCNNGFIKLFLSWTKYKSESTNSSIKWWVIISNFIPIYLKYKYIFFFISISGRIRIRIRIRIRNIFPAKPDPDSDPWKKCRILNPEIFDCRICPRFRRDPLWPSRRSQNVPVFTVAPSNRLYLAPPRIPLVGFMWNPMGCRI